MRTFWAVFAGVAISLAPCTARAEANDAAPVADASAPTYTLRYKFQPGQVLRWQVEHRAEIRTTVGGTTQTAETISGSIKAWRVISVEENGNATFEHLVESVEMRQKLAGRQDVYYNSQTDKQPPSGFEQVAANVGVTLTIFTVDNRGAILRREDKRSQPNNQTGQITIPLPDEAVAVGHTWSRPYDIEVTLKTGELKSIKTRQRFTLAEVTGDVARIEIATEILTPIHDPAIEAQLIQRESAGTVQFDIAAGRIVGQQIDLDKSVVGYAGEGSSLRYITRFSEELLDAEQAAPGTENRAAGGPRKPAARRPIGPGLPPGLVVGGTSDSKGAIGDRTASRKLNNTRR
ncbi:MAG: hypothetical protein K1X74_12910 [Pirellulales bacterium]|nr:hypothetical protein [Pirellulales bacterium]